jgi:hypothetical protein
MRRLKKLLQVTVTFLLLSAHAVAQCSICTKTAQQLGKESAEGLNFGILYLMLLPLAIGGFIAWKWWKNEKNLGTESDNGL